ncbi:MAG: carbon-nitrogen hydrolase [Bacteroidetes bacterium]|nr:carbon-nitrogen hydrolase [Bacteroidota bacterium]
MTDKGISAGYFQFSPVLGDVNANIHILEKAFQSAPLPDILVLPELANSGYNFSSAGEARKYSETLVNSPFLEFLRETSRKRNIYIVSGFNENDGNEIYNTAIITGPEGIVGKYRKIHLFMNEKDYFAPGNLGFQVFRSELGILGMLICFDYIFPEAWRIIAMKGASLICHPSNLVTPYAQKVVPAHSVINRLFVITANRTGTERDLTFTGQSFITDPEGNVFCKAPGDEAVLNFLDLDLTRSDNKMITARNHVFNDRKPGFYKELMD